MLNMQIVLYPNKHVNGLKVIVAPLPATQRFLVNDRYWKKHDGPVFLYIGGEGPLSIFDILLGTV